MTYTPTALNFNGTTSFTYTVSDGNGGQSTARVTITVTPVNDAPVAVNDTATTTAGVPVIINVLGNDTDVDGDVLSVANVANVVGGTVTVNANNTVTYAPNAGFSGAGSFTYRASDPSGALSNVATVSVTVNAVGVDLDIARFTATGTVRLSRAQTVALSLKVRNNSAVNVPGTATLIGTQAGGQVYSQTITVRDPPAAGVTTFAFPAYRPTATGNITWIVTIADGNPDLDQATATTNVRP